MLCMQYCSHWNLILTTAEAAAEAAAVLTLHLYLSAHLKVLKLLTVILRSLQCILINVDTNDMEAAQHCCPYAQHSLHCIEPCYADDLTEGATKVSRAPYQGRRALNALQTSNSAQC